MYRKYKPPISYRSEASYPKYPTTFVADRFQPIEDQVTESDLSLNQNLELGVGLYLTDFNISNLSVDQMGLHSGSDILALMDNYDQKQTITADYTYALIYFKIADQQQGWLVLDANESKAV